MHTLQNHNTGDEVHADNTVKYSNYTKNEEEEKVRFTVKVVNP